ncbi:MAG TPA: APC family permease [Bdellovibrionota bacterium]|nr:APC family permease [Bdellovibrionota bacterium]
MNTTENRSLIRGLAISGLSAAIFNCTVGGGIFRLPGIVYLQAGAWTPHVYLVCGALILCVGFCFALVGRQTLKTGGPYAYVMQAFGPYPGFVAGVLVWLLGTFAMASVANALMDSFAALFPAFGTLTVRSGSLLVLFAGLTLANFRTVQKSSTLLLIVTALKLLPLLALLAFGLPELRGGAILIHAPFEPKSFARTAMLLIFAYMGIESALVPSGEIRDPRKTVPISLAIALASVVVLYVSLQMVSQAVLGDGLSKNVQAPLVAVAGELFGEPGRWFLVAGAAMSMFGFLFSMTLSLPRVLYAFSERGVLPNFFCRLNPNHRTPNIAIATQSALVLVLTVSSSFEALAVLANLSAVLLYILCIAAAWIVDQRTRLSSRSSSKTIVVHACAAVSIGTMLWLLTSISIKEWAVLVCTIAVFSVLYVLAGRRSGRSGAMLPAEALK